jgi:1-acyl-sn-glycerol-3-phosphate acyltransferase
MRGKNGLTRRLIRFVSLLIHLGRGVLTTAALFPFLDEARKRRIIQRWSRKLLNVLHVRLAVASAEPLSTPVFIAANHISWIDIFVIKAVYPARFVSKAEVRAWPVLGWLSAGAGTLFLERERRRDLGRVNKIIAAALHGEDAVAIFPEGTTTLGDTLKRFHASLFEPAVLARAWVYPVALRYTRSDGARSTAPSYVNDMSFMDSIWRILAEPKICAEVIFAHPVAAISRNRRELARYAEAQIREALNLAPDTTPEILADLPSAPPRDSGPRCSPNPARANPDALAAPARTNVRK